MARVFFVHNKIKDIYRIAERLVRILPSIRIKVAHGQMAENELEKVMLAFYAHTVDILVSTAIIGSGLDIPTANTIIIDRADSMGARRSLPTARPRRGEAIQGHMPISLSPVKTSSQKKQRRGCRRYRI